MSDAAPAATTRARQSAWLRRQTLLPPLLITAALLLVGEAISPGFMAARQITDQLTIAAILAIVAAGQNVVIIAGREGIDLSVGATMSLAALVAGNVMQGGDARIPLALLAVLALGFCIGCLNGLGVTLLRIPPLVMTLGSAGIIQGLLVLLTRGAPSGAAAPALIATVTHPLVAGVPGILPIWVGFGALLTWFLRYTGLGANLLLIGANDTAARLCGVPVARTRTLAYGLSGMMAATGGLLLLGYTGTVFVEAGEQYILPTIVAVVIGGTGLAGGSGGYLGTMAGAVVLTLLQSLLITVDIPPAGRQIIFGATLLAFMLLYGRERRLRQ